MFQMKQTLSSQRREYTSVTVVQLRAQAPEGVIVLPAGLLSFKQHGVWEYHAL